MNEQTNQQTDFANQWITKQAAIDALGEKPLVWDDLSDFDLGKAAQWSDDVDAIKALPSAQPYTDAEIQKMQDLEQAQFDKMYQLGYEAGKQAAQAQGMKSRWFNGRCLRCGEHAPFHSMASTYYKSNFCPNCGAWMLEKSEQEHTMDEFMYGQDLGSPEDGSL